MGVLLIGWGGDREWLYLVLFAVLYDFVGFGFVLGFWGLFLFDFLFFGTLFISGYNVRCNQSMYSTTIFIIFWWAVRLGPEVFLYLCHDSSVITPSGEAAATLRGPSLLMDHEGLPRMTHRIIPPHCEIAHSGWVPNIPASR